MNARTILRRLDALALVQLAEHAARLAVALEQAEARAYAAEDAAESWRDDFLRLCEETGQRPGITQAGALVALPGDVQGIAREMRATAAKHRARHRHGRAVELEQFAARIEGAQS
ncbi:hypothetical protein [Xylella phage Bacata]|nr:hypothetical protein JT315_gp57 [Xylella phage Bacata]CAA2367835.1 hypothetical protein [Xylella phage Bacata]